MLTEEPHRSVCPELWLTYIVLTLCVIFSTPGASLPLERQKEMEPSHFDEFTKTLATSTSRRQALKTIAATTLGGILGLGGIGTAFAKCKGGGQPCTKDKHCCSGACCNVNGVMLCCDKAPPAICCPPNSNAACCEAFNPVCCPNGSNATCCPAGFICCSIFSGFNNCCTTVDGCTTGVGCV